MEVQRTLVGSMPVLWVEDRTLPVVRFLVAWRQGAFADPPGAAGATRLCMDMLLRGTEQHDRVAFHALLEEMGTQVQAVTGSDAAFLRVACLARNFTQTVRLIAEALAYPAFAHHELERARTEAIELIRAQRDDDDTVADLFFRRAVYGSHPLARSPQGEVLDLQALTESGIRQAHARLSAGPLVLAFAGEVDAERATEAAEILSRDLPAQGVPTPEPVKVEPPDGLHLVVVDKPERRQVQLRVGAPALDGGHEDRGGFWLGVTAFGGTFTAPFCQEVREKRGWSYTAYAEWDRTFRFRGPMVLRSAPSVHDAVECLALELEMYRGLAEGVIATESIDLAREYLHNRDPLERASAAMLLPIAVKNELLGRPPEELLRGPELLAALSNEAVAPIMRRHLDGERLAAVLVASADDVAQTLRQRFANSHLHVVDYREGLAL